ncbi:MAG: hypothetical protein NW214_13985 [Pseudanabaenaceae cyanobacterium bins.39]|nr:hypothetical protein [Pseudanabaenaceae cyanobacterium bins.39]
MREFQASVVDYCGDRISLEKHLSHSTSYTKLVPNIRNGYAIS